MNLINKIELRWSLQTSP